MSGPQSLKYSPFGFVEKSAKPCFSGSLSEKYEDPRTLPLLLWTPTSLSPTPELSRCWFHCYLVILPNYWPKMHPAFQL